MEKIKTLFIWIMLIYFIWMFKTFRYANQELNALEMFKTFRYANQRRNAAYTITKEGHKNFRLFDILRYVDGLKQGLAVRVATKWQL
jgi:hypothetical protein